MTVDRFGKPIQVGWADHELLWVKAALTLKGYQRTDAFLDISDLTGRGYLNVQAKARQLQERARIDRALVTYAPRRVMVANGVQSVPKPSEPTHPERLPPARY